MTSRLGGFASRVTTAQLDRCAPRRVRSNVAVDVTRKPGFDLAAELAKPGFTPGVRDAGALVELIVGEHEVAATRAAPALASLKDAARRAIVERIQAATVRYVNSAEGRKAFAARSLEPVGSTPGQFTATIEKDIERFAALAKQFNIQPQ